MLVSAFLLAIAMAFCLAFAAPSAAQALDDGIYPLPEFKSGPASNMNHFVSGQSYLSIEGDKATLIFTTDGTTVSIGKYNRFALGKASELVEGEYPKTLKEDAPVFYGVYAGLGTVTSGSNAGKQAPKWSYEITMSKADIESELALEASESADAGIFFIGWNNEESGWFKSSSDQKFTLGTLGDKATPADAVSYALTTTNYEKMFSITSASLVDNAVGFDYLTFTTSGSGYPYAYSGNQDNAVKTMAYKDDDQNWCAIGSGNTYTIPVIVSADSFASNVVMVAGTNKQGTVTDPNYHARSLAIDLTAKTLVVNNASDTAALTVTSTVEGIAATTTGSIEYTGYVRPYAGAELNTDYPLGNNWSSTLTVNLGTDSIYDRAYAVTYNGRPKLKAGVTVKEPSDADYASVDGNGKLVLPVANNYDNKTTQLDGNIIKVMMHVKANAGVAKKDLWVERTFQLDFTSRTTATLEITGDSLDAPMVAPLADRGEDASKDIAAEPNGYGLSITPVEGSTNTYNVAFTGTGLKKHYNGQKTLGYWAGIAIPSITGKYCKYGAGTYADPKTTKTYTAAGADKVRKDDGSYNEGGFDDFWFNLGEADTRDKAYVAVFEDSSASTPSAVYNLDFSKMKLVYGITAANTTNGTIAVAEEATEDDTVKVTATPATGYKLAKMSYSLPGGQLADITDKTEFMMPSGDTTISATFDLISYQVAFESNGGSAVAAQTVNHGAKINKPSDPTRSGYTFDGWYSDKELKTAYDFANAVTADTTLYAKWTENPKPAPEPAVESQAMHRLYNPNSGEHFFTASDLERDHLVSLGWNSEDDGWVAPATSNTPVYRLYNPNAGEHHYTTSVAERDHLVSVGWNYENIGWYSDDAQTVPLYRVYNPNAFANNHHYTTSAAERDWLVGLGWNDEGKAWYGLN